MPVAAWAYFNPSPATPSPRLWDGKKTSSRVRCHFCGLFCVSSDLIPQGEAQTKGWADK
jgi:hypothetical protein